MAEKVYPMTAEGKEKLQKELKNLKLVKRPEVIEVTYQKTLNTMLQKMSKVL